MLERLFQRGWRRQDSLLALALVVFGTMVIIEANRLPPPFFDPLGSAAVPRLVAGILIGLALVLLTRCLVTPPGEARSHSDGPPPTPLVAFGAAILPVIYVAAMQYGFLAFAPASALFVLAMGALLALGRTRTVLLLVPIALVAGYGLDWLLTRFFYIDLPQRSFWTGAV